MQLKLQRADIVCINQSLFLRVGNFTTDVYIYFFLFFSYFLSVFAVLVICSDSS